MSKAAIVALEEARVLSFVSKQPFFLNSPIG